MEGWKAASRGGKNTQGLQGCTQTDKGAVSNRVSGWPRAVQLWPWRRAPAAGAHAAVDPGWLLTSAHTVFQAAPCLHSLEGGANAAQVALALGIHLQRASGRPSAMSATRAGGEHGRWRNGHMPASDGSAAQPAGVCRLAVHSQATDKPSAPVLHFSSTSKLAGPACRRPCAPSRGRDLTNMAEGSLAICSAFEGCSIA